MSQTRCRPGEIRDAIIDYLSGEAAEASTKEIMTAVRRRLDRRIAPSSVRSYLRLNTPQLFLRTSPGRYRLAGAAMNTECEEPNDVQPAAIFHHGKATMCHMDCFDWLANCQANSVHAVVTDPPYGLVEYQKDQQEKMRNGNGGVWRIPPSFDGHKRSPLPRFTTLTDSDLDNIIVFFQKWARLLYPVVVPGANILVASNPLVSHWVATAICRAGFERRGELMRLVMTMRGGDRPKNAHNEFDMVSVMPRSMYEPWLVFRKPLDGRVQDNLRKWKTGGFRRRSQQRPFGDVIKSHPTHKKERTIAPHPSLKPQSFMRKIVRAVLPLGEGVVLDPFAGGGSTLAAANVVGYDSIGIEADVSYFQMATASIGQLEAIET